MWRTVVLAALAILPSGLSAQGSAPVFTVTAGMPVRIELVGFCNVSASNLDFGAYASNQKAPVQGQTTIQLQCSPGTVAELSLDAGTGPGRNTKRRKMEQERGIDRLDYDLYQDPGRTMQWGDNSGRDTVEVEATGAPQAIPVYGQIPGGQRVRDGIYSDVITVTVFY